MKKHRKLLAIILSIAMILTLVPLALFASAEDEYVPYIDTSTNTVNKEDGNYTISSVTELKWLATTVNAGNSYANSNFKLDFKDDPDTVADESGIVDLTGITWTPIGSSSEKAFAGTFDGNGHIVKGLTFGTADARNNGQAAGLFGYVDQGTVKNLAIKDSEFYMTGFLSQVGPIVASLDEGTVANCAVSDVIIDVEYTNAEIFTLNAVGGLVGASTGGTVSESYSTAHISVTAPISIGNYVGGLVGRNNGTVKNTYYAGNVSLGESLIGHVAGLVGNNAGTIENSYTVGLVGGKLTAGIAGINTGTITNCYYFEGSASAGSYKTDDNKTFNADETGIDTFNNSTYLLVSSFASALNGGLVGSLTGAFTGIEDAVEDITGTNVYPFPTLKNNVFEMALLEQDTENFAGGSGTIYDPYKIATPAHLNNVRNFLSDAFVLKNDIVFVDYMYRAKDENIALLQADSDIVAAISTAVNTEGESATVDLATLDLSMLDSSQISAIEAVVGDMAVFEAGAFAGGFTPIGSVAQPFVGNFDGNGHKINNIKITSTGTYAALFVRNLGMIVDLSIDHTDNSSAASVTFAEAATTPSSVTLTTAGTSGAYAAAIAARNNGTVTGATVNVDVTSVSDTFKSYVAGLVAENTGTVKDSANSGIVLAKFSDSAYAQSYKNIAANADIKVAGAVAINKSAALVDSCKTNASARSELTSASNTDGIIEAPYIADNQSEVTTNTTGIAGTVADSYLTYAVPTAYTRPSNAYTDADGLSSAELITGAALNPDGTLTVSATYSELADNYQLVSIAFNEGAYKTNFLAWVELDVSDMTVDTSKADKEFLKGEAFSSAGISVVAENSADENITLSEVKNAADNGYVVKVYSNPECTTEVTNLATALAGTYYVQVTYGGVPVTNNGAITTAYTYTIRVCDVTSIEISADYTTYMVGQAPSLKVTAVYDDSAQTKKVLDDYNVYIADSAEAFANGGGTVLDEFTSTADKTYIGVADGNVRSNVVEVKVLARDVKVSNLTATTSADQTTETANADKIKVDNIKLTWTDEDAPQYRVYRSADGGSTWIKKSSPKNDFYTDSTSVSGESYKYKVVMVIAGEESEGYSELTIVAPIPVKTSADITKATRYVGLYNDFRSTSVKVTATYKNGTTETIGSATDADKAKKSKYYFDTAALNTNVPGKYEIGIMFNGAKVNEIKDNGAEVSKYEVTVVPPSAITATADYTYYPVGYAEDNFKNTLNVKASYPEGTISGTTAVDSADFTTNVTEKNSTEGAQAVTVKFASFVDSGNGAYTPQELTANVNVTFVPNVAPTNVTATAGATGINDVTWNEVAGAVSYNVYRAGTDGIYEIIGEVDDVADTTSYTYSDDTAAPNAVYTYKVAAVIADQETPHSQVTAAITTVAPYYIKATFSDKFVTEYAVGQSLKTTDVAVKAYYPKADYTPAAENADFAALESNTNYTSRDLTKNKKSGSFNYYYTSDYDKATAGTYTVSMTYAGLTTYNGMSIGEKTVTVYPIYKLEATTKDAKYILGYEFTNSDLKVTATYGDATAKPDFKVTTLSNDDFVMLDEPDMSVAGQQTVTVALASNTSVRTTITVNVYDPDKLIEIKDSSAYVEDTENGYITKIQPNTTVDTLKTNLENDSTTIQVVDKNGNALTRTTLATGDKVQLVIGGTVFDEKTIVVLGDTSGDGKVNTGDVTKMLNSFVGINELDGAYLEAGDVNGNGRVNTGDVTKILNYRAGIGTLG